VSVSGSEFREEGKTQNDRLVERTSRKAKNSEQQKAVTGRKSLHPRSLGGRSEESYNKKKEKGPKKDKPKAVSGSYFVLFERFGRNMTRAS